MLKKFLNELEKHAAVETLVARFSNLFAVDATRQQKFTDETFSQLATFLEKGEPSYQNVAVQAGVFWATSSQRVILRKMIQKRGFLTPSCLWAYRQLRGNVDELFRDYPSPDMAFMQILLLKEAEPERAVPFLIEHFLARDGVPEEIRAASRLCVLRHLDAGVSPKLVGTLRGRYPSVEILGQWRPGIPGRYAPLKLPKRQGNVDFHQMVRSIHDMKELSSLTRTVYLTTLFFVPLPEKEWRSLLLSRTDDLYFQRLLMAGILEADNGGIGLSPESTKQTMVRAFLYESYAPAKESVHRQTTERLNEERKRKVRNSELDRQALEIVPDGIICIDKTGLLYYMNPACEKMLKDNVHLRERLFGTDSLELALRRYSRETVLSRVTAPSSDDDEPTEIFGDRLALSSGGRRYEIELGRQVILIRDTTDQFLIDKEIGRLYRHELKAALDVMGVGLDGAKQMFKESRTQEGLELIDQVERKRADLFAMLEEKMDFIRLHSDVFQIRPTLVNLNLVADKCVDNYREAASAKGVVIASNHLHVDAIMVRGEERYLIRAVDNLIRNAVKFTDADSEIEVVVGSEHMEAFIQVNDKGPGIPTENLGKIFQLGFTTGGTGRGLYLARRIAVAHHGRIDVKNSPGTGACFVFRVPMALEA
ncbi:MAG: HAMP domain-containing sensor histidine kinase [Desulfomonilaceae bacterium]|nr:HAMP domain-containing sensor histidine kinase [Desulfomonilaceae bacterium]